MGRIYSVSLIGTPLGGRYFGVWSLIRSFQAQPAPQTSCTLIASGKAKPSFLVSHELPLGDAADAYRHFDVRDEGWSKVVLKPAAAAKRSKAASARR